MPRVRLLLIPAILLAASASFAQPPGGGPGGGGGGQGDGIWRRNAAFGEAQTFDPCRGHQPNNGQYHYHVQPTCLRAQLGDNIELVRNTRVGATYREKASGWTHSPILGWALDGYPIYGPYSYTDPADAASAVKRMASGFRLRSITQRSSLPDWTLPSHAGISQTLTAAQFGPPINNDFPLGRYLEDYEWAQGAGDLDQYNGRFTVTPEFPKGTYAYFTTLDASGAPAFPYVLGGQYYGTATGGTTQSGAANLQDYFNNGIYAAKDSAALNSWTTANSGQFAKIISGWDPSAGPLTTWPGSVPAGAQTSGSVTSPAYAEVQRIRYSGTNVVVSTNGLPGYVFGPWFGLTGNGGVFGNFPSSQNLTFQLPAAPAPATTRTVTGLGACGLWVNGVAVFNFLDGASYSNATGADVGGGGVAAGVLHVSAASFEGGPATPNSIVAAFPIFNATIATGNAAADSPAWPTTLAGATVTVTDSAGTARTAQISYASPAQVNFVVPEGTVGGITAVRIAANGSTTKGSLNIVATYPNLFTVNSAGLAAAYALRPQSSAITNAFRVVNGDLVAQPVSAGTAADPSFLVVVGSGLGSATAATATIGGVSTTVSYAGPQGTYKGVDQYNILIPPSLAGKGSVDVVVAASGKASNAVNITIQ